MRPGRAGTRRPALEIIRDALKGGSPAAADAAWSRRRCWWIVAVGVTSGRASAAHVANALRARVYLVAGARRPGRWPRVRRVVSDVALRCGSARGRGADVRAFGWRSSPWCRRVLARCCAADARVLQRAAQRARRCRISWTTRAVAHTVHLSWVLARRLEQRFERDIDDAHPLRWFTNGRLVARGRARAPFMPAGSDSFGRRRAASVRRPHLAGPRPGGARRGAVAPSPAASRRHAAAVDGLRCAG